MKIRLILTLLSFILFTQFTQSMEFDFSSEEKDESESTDLISLDTSAINQGLQSTFDYIRNYYNSYRIHKLNRELIDNIHLYLNDRVIQPVNFEDIKQLIKKGADVNTLERYSTSFGINDVYGQTPLHTASYYGHIEIIKLLIENGANINTQDKNGRTPLHIAIISKAPKMYIGKIISEEQRIRTNREKTTEFLIQNGANINIKDSCDGSTPLHSAVSNGHLKIVEILLKNDADITIKNNNNQTAYDLASYYASEKYIKKYYQYVNIDIKIADLLKNKEQELKNKYQEYLIKRLLLRLKIIFEKTVQDSNNNNQVSKIPKEIYNKEVASYFNTLEIEKIFNTTFEHWYKNTFLKINQEKK